MKRRNHLGIVLRRRITHTDLTGWCFRCTDFYVSCFPHLDNKISLFPCFAFFQAGWSQTKQTCSTATSGRSNVPRASGTSGHLSGSPDGGQKPTCQSSPRETSQWWLFSSSLQCFRTSICVTLYSVLYIWASAKALTTQTKAFSANRRFEYQKTP